MTTALVHRTQFEYQGSRKYLLGILREQLLKTFKKQWTQNQ
jgi:hypothetical protein